jgi:hypothetical protein
MQDIHDPADASLFQTERQHVLPSLGILPTIHSRQVIRNFVLEVGPCSLFFIEYQFLCTSALQRDPGIDQVLVVGSLTASRLRVIRDCPLIAYLGWYDFPEAIMYPQQAT